MRWKGHSITFCKHFNSNTVRIPYHPYVVLNFYLKRTSLRNKDWLIRAMEVTLSKVWICQDKKFAQNMKQPCVITMYWAAGAPLIGRSRRPLHPFVYVVFDNNGLEETSADSKQITFDLVCSFSYSLGLRVKRNTIGFIFRSIRFQIIVLLHVAIWNWLFFYKYKLLHPVTVQYFLPENC